tara:strand:- start:7 stop:252 length:246 start_codon:yes stop_codon:yes gene_type:complete
MSTVVLIAALVCECLKIYAERLPTHGKLWACFLPVWFFYLAALLRLTLYCDEGRPHELRYLMLRFLARLEKGQRRIITSVV